MIFYFIVKMLGIFEMRKLIPKNYDEKEFDSLTNEKSRIKADIINIKKRFQDFEVNKYKLENLKQQYIKPKKCKNIDDLRCDLYKLYDSTNYKFKEEIQKISGDICPYCGIDRPSHLDHFIPRSKFPEFSIYSPNLIYVCSICNSKYKGEKILNSKGERIFFNPYFDNFIETIQFLKCRIIVNDIYPKFEFYIEDLSKTSSYEYTIMKNHFEAMNLKINYMNQIVNQKFKKFKNRYVNLKERTYYEISLEQIKNYIEETLREYQEENINNWEKVFWESLKESEECLNLIVNKVIPI